MRFTVPILLLLSTVFRLLFLLYGLYQDSTSPFKYTDIDYYVFTDASRFVARSLPPYHRSTYRYTPLLAWILLPTTFQPQWLWFSFGKVLFAAGDILAGYLIIKVLEGYGMRTGRAMAYASLWLLNPMVATISTRGSSEGLLGAMVVALLYAVEKRMVVLSGAILGLSVHFKIYPFIYAPAIVWWMEPKGYTDTDNGEATFVDRVTGFITKDRIIFAITAFGTFMGLNVLMYSIYGHPFIIHTYLHHVTRIDHRHNFSPYNTLLHLTAAPTYTSSTPLLLPKIESLAFAPQILISAIILPLLFSKYDLPTTMFTQTFAFVTFNKVCTSQYFMWYLVLLPFYLPRSSLLQPPGRIKGILALALWVGAQALWLQQGYMLEFLGNSTFYPGLWIAGLLFYVVNIWILGIVVGDIKDTRGTSLDVDSDAKTTNLKVAGQVPPDTGDKRENRSSISPR